MNVENGPPFFQMINAKKTTFLIFFVLLVFRVYISYLQQWKWNGEVPWWEASFYQCVMYWLISIVIWLNRDNLRSLNMDRNFIKLFLFMGGLYSLLSPLGIGIVMGLAVFINLHLYLRGLLPFENIPLNFWQTILFTIIMMAPAVIIPITFGFIKTWPSDTALFAAAYIAGLPIVIFEEVIYRGMLWMLLTNLNVKSHYIFIIQVILFWLSHINYLSQPLTFWLYIPFGGVMLGLMVWRSKTITSSIVGHFLYNWLASVLRTLI